jgi:hypothetical protein
MAELIDKISKYGLVLIFLGYLNIYFYYDYFGIQIYHYLEASEIIFSFSSLIQTFYFALILVLLASISAHLRKDEFEKIVADARTKAAQDVKEKVGEERPSSKTQAEKKKFWVRVKEKAVLIVVALIGNALFYVLFLLVGGFLSNLKIDNSKVKLVFEMAFVLCLLLIYTFVPRKSRNSTAVYFGYLSIVVAFLYIRTYSSYTLVKDNNAKYSAAITLDDQNLISSNDSIKYVGSVRQYHFLHNIKSGENIVIPSATVKKIVIKELRGGL